MYPIFLGGFFVAEFAGDLKEPTTFFLDLRQFDITQKPWPAGAPHKIKFQCFERNVGVDCARISADLGGFDIADDINRTRLTLHFDFGTCRNPHD